MKNKTFNRLLAILITFYLIACTGVAYYYWQSAQCPRLIPVRFVEPQPTPIQDVFDDA